MAILSQPRLQFQDLDGNPLAGSLLYTYSVGIIPKVTYSDPTLTTPLSNPVVSDATGTFPAIYFDGSAVLTLKDSDDVLIWTTEGVTASGGGFALIDDPDPTLGGNLNTNGFYVKTAGNPILKFIGLGSAVNELTISNAITGDSPTISATGTDGNVDLTLEGKGSGNIVLNSSVASPLTIGDAATAGGVTLKELPANGTDAVTLQAPDSLAASYDITLPDAQGGVTTVLSNAGDGTLTWVPHGGVIQRQSDTLVGATQKSLTGGDTAISNLTFPSGTQGAIVMQIVFTPVNVNSIIKVTSDVLASGTSGVNAYFAITVNGAISGSVFSITLTPEGNSIATTNTFATGTLSPITIQIRGNENGASHIFINGNSSTYWSNGASSYLIVEEIALVP